MRLWLAVWLLGHGVPLDTPTDRISLVPLALTAFAAWRVARAGVHASRAVGGHRRRGPGRGDRRGRRGGGRVRGSSGPVRPRWPARPTSPVSLWRAAVTTGLFGLVAAPPARSSRPGRRDCCRRCRRRFATASVPASWPRCSSWPPGRWRPASRSRSTAATPPGCSASYRTGVLGQAGITVLCLAYAPNLAVWGAAYLLGPGFAVGVDTS